MGTSRGRGYDQLKGWSNSEAKGQGLHLMGLWMACFPMQSYQGFSGFGLNLQVSDEEEVEESVSEDEADPEVFPDTPSPVSLPGEAEIPAEAGSAPTPTGAFPSNSHGLEARTIEAARSSTPNI